MWQTDRRTDGRTDGQTENTICRAAWSQLKTIGHLFYAISSFVQHFVPTGEFKLELQSGNAQSGSNSMIFKSRVTLKFDGSPWITIGHLIMLFQALCSISYPLVNSNWSYSPETPNLGQIRRFLEPCDLEIWRMALKNNREPLLSNIKLCVSFCHHMWIQTRVTVRKRLSWVVTSVTLTFVLHGRYPGPWWYLLTISWSYDDRNIVKKVWRKDGQTDRQTDRRTDRKYHS